MNREEDLSETFRDLEARFAKYEPGREVSFFSVFPTREKCQEVLQDHRFKAIFGNCEWEIAAPLNQVGFALEWLAIKP